jgi:hypothetical protein
MSSTDWKWYITVAAIRQWMALTHRSGDLEMSNPAFEAAQNELGELSLVATLAVEATERQRTGGSVYRGRIMVAGKSRRVEGIVMPPIRAEGPLPQLVRVTAK